MKTAGQIALTLFPYTDLSQAKKRPVLLLKELSSHNDWLVCMISSQLHQADPDLDLVMDASSPEFANTGLKVDSVIRLSRLAVLDSDILLGSIGELSNESLLQIKTKLSHWLLQND